MDEQYYQKQITGLLIILDDADSGDVMISREYIKEKLQMILEGGIGFHPLIQKRLEHLYPNTTNICKCNDGEVCDQCCEGCGELVEDCICPCGDKE